MKRTFTVEKVFGQVIAVIQVVQTLKNPNPLSVIASSWQQLVSWRCLPGALMSAGKLDYPLVLTIHRVAPVVPVLCSAAALHLLRREL